MITFEISFNELLLKSQLKLAFKLYFKRTLKILKGFLVAILILLSLGIIVGIGSKEFLNPYFYSCAMFLILAIIVGGVNFSLYSILTKNVNDMVKDCKENNLVSSYEFSDIGIKYFNEIKCSEIKWNGFTEFSILEENIFIVSRSSIGNTIIIGKKEITLENYTKLIELLNQKLTLKEIKK